MIYSSEKYRLLVVLNFNACTVKMFLNASFNFSTTLCMTLMKGLKTINSILKLEVPKDKFRCFFTYYFIYCGNSRSEKILRGW